MGSLIPACSHHPSISSPTPHPSTLYIWAAPPNPEEVNTTSLYTGLGYALSLPLHILILFFYLFINTLYFLSLPFAFCCALSLTRPPGNSELISVIKTWCVHRLPLQWPHSEYSTTARWRRSLRMSIIAIVREAMVLWRLIQVTLKLAQMTLDVWVGTPRTGPPR